MKLVLRLFAAAVVVSLLGGCYAAKIETGLKPSSQVIEKDWAACWIYGLVPPPTLQMASLCPNGVAIVETQLSFLNQLVSGITFGIYTPMQIRVTCAEKGTAGLLEPSPDFVLRAHATDLEIREAFSNAAREAIESHRPVAVRLSTE